MSKTHLPLRGHLLRSTTVSFYFLEQKEFMYTPPGSLCTSCSSVFSSQIDCSAVPLIPESNREKCLRNCPVWSDSSDMSCAMYKCTGTSKRYLGIARKACLYISLLPTCLFISLSFYRKWCINHCFLSIMNIIFHIEFFKFTDFLKCRLGTNHL